MMLPLTDAGVALPDAEFSSAIDPKQSRFQAEFL